MPHRQRLPQRRLGESFTFNFAGQHDYKATVGFYEDGRVGEIFLNHNKITTAMDIAARDAAIALSFALQYGATISALRDAMTRDAKGQPEGALGVLLDLLHERGYV